MTCYLPYVSWYHEWKLRMFARNQYWFFALWCRLLVVSLSRETQKPRVIGIGKKQMYDIMLIFFLSLVSTVYVFQFILYHLSLVSYTMTRTIDYTPRNLHTMMTSSNGNIFRVTGHLCGELSAQRQVTRSLDVFFDLRLNKQLNKHSWGWWFKTLTRTLL